MRKILFRMNSIKISELYSKGGVFNESEAEIKTTSIPGSNTKDNYHHSSFKIIYSL